MISLPNSGIESISIWIVLGVSFITGALAGMLGVGGGFVRMPLLIYVGEKQLSVGAIFFGTENKPFAVWAPAMPGIHP